MRKFYPFFWQLCANSMFPMKEKSNQTVFSFLNLILLMQASVDRLTLNYCNKNPPDTPSIPIDSLNRNPDFPKVQVNHGAEGSIGGWNLLPHIGPRQGNNNLNSGTLLRKPWKNIARLPSVLHRSSRASKTDSNDKI